MANPSSTARGDWAFFRTLRERQALPACCSSDRWYYSAHITAYEATATTRMNRKKKPDESMKQINKMQQGKILDVTRELGTAKQQLRRLSCSTDFESLRA